MPSSLDTRTFQIKELAKMDSFNQDYHFERFGRYNNRGFFK